MRCEVCQAPATVICSGLDVQELGFCDEHGYQHASECPDVARGAAWMTRIGENPEEKMTKREVKRTLVVYHADCVDGFTAAWAVHQVEPDAAYHAARYGDEPSLDFFLDYDRVRIVDFSYSRELTERIHATGKDLRVFDHHKTAEENLRGLDYCVFDMERSGCGIVWDELVRPHLEQSIFSEIPRPWIIDYAEDRDLWRFALPSSREVNAFLRSTEMTFDNWDKLYKMGKEEIIQHGIGSLAHIKAYVRAAVKHTQMVSMGGEVFPIVNITYESCSEVAQCLCQMYPEYNLAGYWFVRGDGNVQYGFRSIGDFDVGEFARKFGGGGHKDSAGCVAREAIHQVT